MKNIFLIISCLLFSFCLYAQQQNATALQDSARLFMRQGDFEKALTLLNQALVLKPGDLEILKDQVYVNFLKRDFAKAMETAKQITERPDADVQTFQLSGSTYKAIAEYAEADKVYKKALEKFPNSGVLYSEYGDLLVLEKNMDEAIKQWEKGIEADTNQSSNYYYAAKYYAGKGEALHAVLYGETFVNIESLTARTKEIKAVLFDNYKKLLTANSLNNIFKNGTAFEKAISETYRKVSGTAGGEITLQSLIDIRSKFTEEWYNTKSALFPYRLFQHYYFLVKQSMFNAYNQWLFEGTANSITVTPEELQAFQNYQRSVVYKIPQGQYYK